MKKQRKQTFGVVNIYGAAYCLRVQLVLIIKRGCAESLEIQRLGVRQRVTFINWRIADQLLEINSISNSNLEIA